MRLQVDVSFLLPGDFDACRITAGVEQSAAAEPTLGFGRPSQLLPPEAVACRLFALEGAL